MRFLDSAVSVVRFVGYYILFQCQNLIGHERDEWRYDNPHLQNKASEQRLQVIIHLPY